MRGGLIGPTGLLLGSCLAFASGLQAQDFWKHWGDGRAELSSYRLTQPRYGGPRSGTAVLVFVTEDFSDSARVKADPGQHPASDLYPVLKLNAVRDFQTGIYDYNVMTSVFARVADGFPVAKVSFSSQEWCGHVYHQLLPRPGEIESVSHSYFDGEADMTRRFAMPPGAVLEDALPILLRGLVMSYLGPGESNRVSLLPSLLRARLAHEPLDWESATISRSAKEETVAVPAGRFQTTRYTVAIEGVATLTYQLEAAYPHRVVRYSTDKGEEMALLGSRRLAYWKLNGPGGETYLRELKLKPPSAR